MTESKRFWRRLRDAFRINDLEHARKLLCSDAHDNTICNNFIFDYIHNVDIVKLLLEHGMDANIKNYHGYTPLYYSIKHGLDDVTKLLLEYNANVAITTNEEFKETPLTLALSHKNLRTIKILLDHNADPNVRNYWGDTPLHIASSDLERTYEESMDSRDIQIQIIKLLLANGADWSLVDQNGNTAKDIAKDFCSQDEIDDIFGMCIGKLTKAAR